MSRSVESFEHEFAAWLGVAGAVAAGFGRSALWLALETAAVRSGEVLVPDFVCSQVPEAVRLAGARPISYPVPRSLAVDPAEIAVRCTPSTRAVLAVHYFGRVQPRCEEIRAICREHNALFIEDCALALGAQSGGSTAGTYGDLAVFSLTKSDWCYGGGVVAATSENWLHRLRSTAQRSLRGHRGLSWWYGALRCLDFRANRPRWAHAAEWAGRRLQRVSGLSEENFYDAGRFDAALPAFAARRARRVLKDLPAVTARRRQILHRLIASLDNPAKVLLHPQPDPGETAAFLPIVCPPGEAGQWVEQAARKGVTLRRCWPAYQSEDGETTRVRPDLAWLAEHLLVLELHSRLTSREVHRIALTLRELTAGPDALSMGD